MFIEIPSSLKKLSKFFPENLYVVGGYVRGKLLNLESDDVDIASCVLVEDVAKRLEGTEFSVKIKNAKLGAALICCDGQEFQYTTFRAEEYENGGHVPSQVQFVRTVEEDVKRRDFSINCIYYNINKDKCEDPAHGLIDLSDKIVRASGDEVFSVDGERVLRMVRIAGELNFKIEKSTFLAAKKGVGNLAEISGTRKFAEIEKILFCDKRYNLGKLSKALNLLQKLGVWQVLKLAQRVKYNMVFKAQDRFLGLMIDIVDSQKPACLQSFVDEFLKTQFGFNSAERKKVFEVLSGYYSALRKMKNKDFFFNFFDDFSSIEPLLQCKSSRLQAKYAFFYNYIKQHSLIIKVEDLAVSSEDISQNFPQIDKRSHSRILTMLLSKVFDGKVANEKELLLKEVKAYIKL